VRGRVLRPLTRSSVVQPDAAAEEEAVKGPQPIECLCCGERRGEGRPEPECPRCGYLGWARADSLDEPTRRLLRERTLPARRLRLIA
jgi:hypothetical protein